MLNRYHDVCYELVFHVMHRAGIDDRRDLCAVYHFGCAADKLNLFPWTDNTVVHVGPDVSVPQTGNGYVEEAVLIPIVEVSEQSEEGRQAFVRSMVRLCPLDFCPHAGAESAGFLGRSMEMEPLRVVADREREDIGAWGRITLGLRDSDCVDEVVQRAPQVVNHITRDQRPLLKIGRVENGDDPTVSGEIRARVVGESIRVGITPGRNITFEGFEMHLGAVKFCPYTG